MRKFNCAEWKSVLCGAIARREKVVKINFTIYRGTLNSNIFGFVQVCANKLWDFEYFFHWNVFPKIGSFFHFSEIFMGCIFEPNTIFPIIKKRTSPIKLWVKTDLYVEKNVIWSMRFINVNVQLCFEIFRTIYYKDSKWLQALESD